MCIIIRVCSSAVLSSWCWYRYLIVARVRGVHARVRGVHARVRGVHARVVSVPLASQPFQLPLAACHAVPFSLCKGLESLYYEKP